MSEVWSAENKEAHGAEGDLTFDHSEIQCGREFRYFKDKKGNLFYESDTGSEMDEIIKRRKEEADAAKRRYRKMRRSG